MVRFLVQKMNEEYLQWLKELIKENRMHEFYVSKEWRRKAKDILKQRNYECERCKKKGLVSDARTVHHKEYIKRHPELALEDSNLEAICVKCHYEEHHRKKKKFMNEERW